MKKVIYLILVLLLTTNFHGAFAIDTHSDPDSVEISLPRMVNNILKDEEGATIENEEKVYSNKYVSVNINRPIVKIVKNKEAEGIINNKISKRINDFEEYITKLSIRDNEYNIKVGLETKPYVINVNNNVTYNKNNILSITLNLYSYTGGAHGSSVDESFNFDINTGNRGVIEDFLGNNRNYNKIILDNVKATINKNPELYFKEAVDKLNVIPYNQKFFLTDKDLVIYFDEYEIAPYVAGIPKFYIPLSKFPKGLNKVNIQVEAPIIKTINYEESSEDFNQYLSYPKIENMINKDIEMKINNYIKDEVFKFIKDIKASNTQNKDSDKYVKGVTTYYKSLFKDKNSIIFYITYSGNNRRDENIFLNNKIYEVNLQSGEIKVKNQ
ncbi:MULTISPECIES: PdaC/SigV domain-containing protein [unclassified Clostridium]|uniref:PdaC/SigV domain-containing protein n=1 Tax=unclassified Clostridium TaxID=2614128 RepID=UPI003217CE97